MIYISFMIFNEIQTFLGKIEIDDFTVSNNENTTFGFSLFGTTIFMNSRLKVLHKKV